MNHYGEDVWTQVAYGLLGRIRVRGGLDSVDVPIAIENTFANRVGKAISISAWALTMRTIRTA